VEQVANQVVVKVIDSGVGIDTDMLPRVFDMFTQVGRTLGRSQGGLGIGLSLVKRLVEKHGGWVSATSNGPGSGSTFAIWLPTCDGPAENMEDATAVDSQPCRQPLRILVVDDNADAAESLSMIFQLDGHEVLSAGTGPEAISAALRVSPHVIFLDIGLPGMNGYEVARAVRAELGASAPVLVALTGWGSEDDKRKSKEAGFDCHLTKPVDVDRVGDLLRKVDCNKVATGVRVDTNQETDTSTHHLLNTPLVCDQSDECRIPSRGRSPTSQ
jgi:CheY-like chemotaxis protein